MILKTDQFIGPINIIGIHDEGASSAAKVDDLGSFIKIYEPIYIQKILGPISELFNNFLKSETQEEERWVKLKELLSGPASALARYVFFFYARTKVYSSSSTGIFSEGDSPVTICVQTWNDNRIMNKAVYDLLSNGSYEGFEFDCNLLKPIW